MNTIQLMGRLGADAETRFTPSGQKVVTLRLACNSKKRDQEETIWYRVTLWGDRWDRILPYLTKGTALIVVGELRKPEVYNNREGSPSVSLEVWADSVRFSPFGGRSGEEQGAGQQGQQGQQTYGGQQMTQASSDPWGQPSTPAQVVGGGSNNPGANNANPFYSQPSQSSFGGEAHGATSGAYEGGQATLTEQVSEDEIPF